MSNRELIVSLLSKYQKSYPISENLPQPIEITVRPDGPFQVSSKIVLCDLCGAFIRKSYLINHRESGACSRRVLRKGLEANNPPNNLEENLRQNLHRDLYLHQRDCLKDANEIPS